MTESPANLLCKACGLCCTGHLFVWAKLRSAELSGAQALRLNVFGSEPKQRGFSQPCPLWNGNCTAYTSPHYPHFCKTYKCKLLKQLLDETTQLPAALLIVTQAKEKIAEVESLLPVSAKENFRERLVEHVEKANPSFKQKAEKLALLYEHFFGVKDLLD